MRYDIRHRLLTLMVLCLMIGSAAATPRPAPQTPDQTFDLGADWADPSSDPAAVESESISPPITQREADVSVSTPAIEAIGARALAERPVEGVRFEETAEQVGGRLVLGRRAYTGLADAASAAEAARDPEATRIFEPFFPNAFSDPFVVSGGGVLVAVRPLDAVSARADIEQGRVVYRGAYQSTDSIHRVTADRSEEFLLLDSPLAPTRFTYEVVHAEGVSQIYQQEGGIVFAGRQGRGLRIERPYVVDVDGVRHDDVVKWRLGKKSRHTARRLVLELEPQGLSYPIAIDPTWAPVGNMTAGRRYHTATLLQSGKVLVAGGDTSTSALQRAEVYDPSTGRWTATAPPRFARTRHTATLLPNGKVLLVGGMETSGTGYVANPEVYNPADGTWTTMNPMSTPRREHTATLLRSGKVLVVGGQGSSGFLASAELYDPAANGGLGSWSSTANAPVARSVHTATLLADGRVLVAGGSKSPSYLNSAQIYDPATNSWNAPGATPNMAFKRNTHTATLLPDGRVLVAGGFASPEQETCGGSCIYLNSAELFDPTTNGGNGSWRTTGTLNDRRWAHTATLLPNGTVLVASGSNWDGLVAGGEIYTPGTGLWSRTSTGLSTARIYFTSTLLASGQLLVAGGVGGPARTSGAIVASSELYDPAGSMWSGTTSMTVPRDSFTATLLPNGKVLVAGGPSDGGAAASAEAYDPKTSGWTRTLNLGDWRHYHTATLLANGRVLVAGGSVNGETELYDPATNAWSTAGSLAIPRWYHAATLLADGRLLVVGGTTNAGDTRTAELYDPTTNSWTRPADMLVERRSPTATLLPNGTVLVVGGFGAGTVRRDAEVYDPATDTWSLTGTLAVARFGNTATLLPSGQVLIAGGYDRNVMSIPVSSAEVYDPATGNWSPAGSMSTVRNAHSATLLLDGRVLVVGGEPSWRGAPVTSVDVYDPATNSWSPARSLTVGRKLHTATLLANGRVLLAGGSGDQTTPTSAELYDAALGFDSAWQPDVQTATSTLAAGASFSATGVRFRGLSEGSGGSVNGSATNFPLVQLRSLETGQTRFLPVDPASGWSDTSFRSTRVWDFPQGWALATVFANGIPSASSLVLHTGIATRTTLAVTAQGSCGGQGPTLTATVALVSGTPDVVLTGSVQFLEGSTLLGSALLAGNGTATLTLATLDGGTHSITARYSGDINYASSSSAPCLVSPAGAPSITSQPESTTIASGTSATLTVVAGGSGSLIYEWYEGTSGTTTTPVGTNSSSYTTTPLTATGSYWVRVSNDCGSADSNAATVMVSNGSCTDALQFSATSYKVVEKSTTITITVTRTGMSCGAVTAAYATSDNTATAGSDYLPASGMLSFAAGDTSKTFTVSAQSDTLAEGDESFNLTLSSPTGGAKLGQNSRAVVAITDNDPAGVLQLSTSAYTVAESGASAKITVSRLYGSAGSVTVSYTTSNNTATAGSDYTTTSGTLTLADAVTSKTFTVPVANDALAEGNEALHLTLSSPTGGATIGHFNRASLVIADDDVPAAGITLSAAFYKVNEGTQAAIVVKRNSTTTAQSVTLTTSANGTAVAGTDYTSVSQTLSFAVGQASQTVKISTMADAGAEGIESFNATLADDSGGSTLGAQRSAVVLIDDGRGTLQFSQPEFVVNEADGTVTITVTRTDATAGSVSVQYTVGDNTATAAGDYSPVSGTLTFATGVVSRTFTVAITDDVLKEGAESLNLTLSSPTGGATLGQGHMAVLTIADND